MKKKLIPLTQIMSQRLTFDHKPGIYFLFQKDKLMYIGSSVNPDTRIQLHKHLRRFDSFAVVPCKMSELKQLETHYIVAYKPKENIKPPCGPTYRKLMAGKLL